MRALESAEAKSSNARSPVTVPLDADSFDADRERIRASVSRWAHGTGATLRFLKEATGERLSLIFVDEASPTFDAQASVWTIQTKAQVAGGKVVGHFVLLLDSLQPGKYRGDDHVKAVRMGVLMGEPAWDAQNPETAWSFNRESWCDIEISSPSSDGAIESNFRGRLVDNKGTGFINIESGFLFMKR